MFGWILFSVFVYMYHKNWSGVVDQKLVYMYVCVNILVCINIVN